MPIKKPEKTSREDVIQFLKYAYMGDLAGVQEMLLSGTVDVNDCLDDESFDNVPAGTTVLMIAAMKANKPLIEFLLGKDYEFSHHYVARDAEGNIQNIAFYEDYASKKLALNGINLIKENADGENAFSLALKSKGERKNRDDIAAALLDAMGAAEFRKLPQTAKPAEEIQEFFYPITAQTDTASNISDDGMSYVDDEEFSADTDSEFSADESVSFTTGNLLAALVQQAQRNFIITNAMLNPLQVAMQQKLPQTSIRLLKLGLTEVAKTDDFFIINSCLMKGEIKEQEPMDHATRENRDIIEQISYKIGTRAELGDELYKRNLDNYYKALHYADLDEQDNLFHLMQILLQKNEPSNPDRNGVRFKIPTADYVLVQRVIRDLMQPAMFSRRFAGGSLMFAAQNADESTITLLANMGVSVLEPDAEGITPIRFMAEKGNLAAVRSLWARGALLTDIATVPGFEGRRFVFFYNEPKSAAKVPFYGTALQFAALTNDSGFVDALLNTHLVALLAGKEQVQQIANILRKPEFADMRETLEIIGLPVPTKNMCGLLFFSACFGAGATANMSRKEHSDSRVLTSADSRTATRTPSPDNSEDGMRITPTIELSSSSRKRLT